MKNTLIRIAVTASLLAGSITPAYAYLSPDDVFQGIVDLPGRREGEDRVAEQQKVSADRRAEEQKALTSIEDEPEQPAPVLQPAAPEEPTEEQGSLLDDDTRYDRRQERQQGLNNGGTTIIIQNGEAVVRDRTTGEVLHSGAPIISRTGPGEFLAAMALFIAASLTFVWAKWKEKKVVS